MSREYWIKQPIDKPLYEDLLWSRPENKIHAGKLLIVGGNAHGFSAPAEAYQEALKAGIGTCRVLLPDTLQPMVSKIFPAAEYGPSTPSGSFGTKTLAELIDLSLWSDGVLLSDNFGKNSETAILFEKYLDKYKGPLTLVGDSLDYFLDSPDLLLQREETLIVPTFSQLQKLATKARFITPFTSTMGLLMLVDTLHEFTKNYKATIVLSKEDFVVSAFNGAVVTTETPKQVENKIAAHTTTWWLQNKAKPLEACATAISVISNQ